MHPYASYWNVSNPAGVPGQTGAAHWMDGRDFRELAEALGLEYPFGTVLDVGCGTGRAAAHCAGYTGVDIAESAIAYCRARQIDALLIDSVSGLPDMWVDRILCMSVFTHIDRPERQAYLAAFRTRSDAVLVDIIPGDGGGNVALWTADDAAFRADCQQAGWTITGTTDRIDGGVRHRYFALTAHQER